MLYGSNCLLYSDNWWCIVVSANMLLIISVLLTIYQSILAQEPPSTCDFFAPTKIDGSLIYFQSPNATGNYPANTNCRWSTKTQIGYQIIINCYNVYLPSSTECRQDRFEVSKTGRKDLLDSERFCGSGSFTRVSVSNMMVASLKVVLNPPKGYIQCSFKAQKITNCNCGVKKTTKIVGGIPTDVNEYPMMAGLVDISSKNAEGNYEPICGATIIHQSFGITAAHCIIKGKDYTNYVLLVGDDDFNRADETTLAAIYRINQIIIHEAYIPNSLSQTTTNDICLLRTSTPIAFNSGVGPVCLPFKYVNNNFVNAILQLVGWGTTDFGSPKSSKLRKVNVTGISTDDCRRRLPGKTITENQLCTYAEAKDACQGDSGGPAFFENFKTVYLAGVISFGVLCANGNTPGVQTRVTQYLKWIVDRTEDGTLYYCDK